MPWSFVLLAALASSPPASTPAARAEALTRHAMTEFDGGEFDDALADVKRAYAIEPVPGLLYNLAQCHRALHQMLMDGDGQRFVDAVAGHFELMARFVPTLDKLFSETVK